MTSSAVRAAMAGLLAGLMMLVAAGCGQGTAAERPAADRLRVSAAWIRVPVAGDKMTAAYATIHAGRRGDRLLGVRIPVARSARLHTTVRHGRTESMRAMEGLRVAAGQTVTLAPAHDHIMVMGLRTSLHPGDRVEISFRFAHAGTIKVRAAARGFGHDEGHG